MSLTSVQSDRCRSSPSVTYDILLKPDVQSLMSIVAHCVVCYLIMALTPAIFYMELNPDLRLLYNAEIARVSPQTAQRYGTLMAPFQVYQARLFSTWRTSNSNKLRILQALRQASQQGQIYDRNRRYTKL